MDIDEKCAKHLEFVQGVVNRLASNSFSYKGWAVTIVSALVALAISQDTDPLYFLAAIIPVICFWGLDGYCLRQERLFRKLYDRVRTVDVVDYSMHTQVFQKEVGSWWRVCWSKTIAFLYLPIFLLIIGASFVGFYLKMKGGS